MPLTTRENHIHHITCSHHSGFSQTPLAPASPGHGWSCCWIITSVTVALSSICFNGLCYMHRKNSLKSSPTSSVEKYINQSINRGLFWTAPNKNQKCHKPSGPPEQQDVDGRHWEAPLLWCLPDFIFKKSLEESFNHDGRRRSSSLPQEPGCLVWQLQERPADRVGQ